MAIELCSAGTIPSGVSFSRGLCSSMQQHSPLLPSTSLPSDSSFDFEFDVRINNIDEECYHSSADELFSDGKILPLQVRKLEISPPQPPPRKPKPQAANATPKNTKVTTQEADDQNRSSRTSFWQFKRSSSLNFVSGYKRRLFPSTLLSRSSSTGSAPKVKPGGPNVKEGHHDIGFHRQNYQKEKSYPWLQSSTNNRRPPLKKSSAYYGSHGNGVTINPILHVPLVDVFCFSSVFLTGKDKKK
ncbi:hypothetical protein PTKIN_Ptkin12aG0053600 [Pterospermum kingtungense]